VARAVTLCCASVLLPAFVLALVAENVLKVMVMVTVVVVVVSL
jgi:hypothetical protein